MLAVAGTTHLVSGLGRSMRILFPGVKLAHFSIRGPKFWAVVCLLGLAGFSTALAATGLYFPIDLSKDELKAMLDCYRKYWPAFLLPPV